MRGLDTFDFQIGYGSVARHWNDWVRELEDEFREVVYMPRDAEEG